MIENSGSDRTEALAPDRAREMWLQSKQSEWAQATYDLQSHYSGRFVDWLGDRGIDDTRDITARTVKEYELELKSKDLAQGSVAQVVATARKYLRFVASVDGVNPSVPERIEIPARGRSARDEMLTSDRAETTLGYLSKYQYASQDHVLLLVLWRTGIRSGTLRGLDVEDVETAQNRLRVRHRPESGTPLKNGESAERFIALQPRVVEVLEDYIADIRDDFVDEYGRRPLFHTDVQRITVKWLRRHLLGLTRPCVWVECPHGENPKSCSAAQTLKDASGCPSSRSGHPIRRGAITHFLRNDVPEKVVSDRMNVSEGVLDEHYDRRSEGEKTDQRREYLDNI